MQKKLGRIRSNWVLVLAEHFNIAVNECIVNKSAAHSQMFVVTKLSVGPIGNVSFKKFEI